MFLTHCQIIWIIFLSIDQITVVKESFTKHFTMIECISHVHSQISFQNVIFGEDFLTNFIFVWGLLLCEFICALSSGYVGRKLSCKHHICKVSLQYKFCYAFVRYCFVKSIFHILHNNRVSLWCVWMCFIAWHYFVWMIFHIFHSGMVFLPSEFSCDSASCYLKWNSFHILYKRSAS